MIRPLRSAAICVLGYVVLVWAAQGPPAPAEEPARAATAAASQPAAAAAPSGRVEAAALLNESRWAIELHRMFVKPEAPPLSDTLAFSGGQLTSERLGPLGYGAGPFTLSIGAGGAPAWEATQLNQKDGIVLWKGELDRGAIRGTMSRLPLEGNSEDFRFTGQEILAEKPVPPPDAPAPPDQGAAP